MIHHALRHVLLGVVALLPVAFPAAAQRPDQLSEAVLRHAVVADPVVAVTDVRVVDGTGGPARTGQTVVVRDGRIAEVGPSSSVEVPPGARMVEGEGRTLLPGWVMVHEHMFYVSGNGRYNTQSWSFPRLYLAGGATTIRTGGSMEPYTDMNLRDAVAAGRVPGPRIDATGPYVEGEGLPIASVHGQRDVEDTRRFVRYWADEGVDSYKVYNLLSRDMLRATVEEAHGRGMKVIGHLCSITYREAADLGIDNLEHGFVAATDFVEGKDPDACPRGGNTESLLAVDLEGAPFRSLVDHLVERGVALTSTLPVFETFTPGRPAASPGALDALLPTNRDEYMRRWSSVAVGDSPWRELFPKAMAMEKAFHDAGGLLVAGTDPTGYGGVVAGFANIRAVELLIEAGLDLEGAVRVATLNGAIYLEREDDIGTIEPGKRADLILIGGDPGVRPADLRNVEIVFKDGVGYDPASLRAEARGQVGLR